MGFHEAAITEMTRVGAVARIFPTFAMGADPVLDLDPLLHRLRRRGIDATLRPVDYLFQRGHPSCLWSPGGPDDSRGHRMRQATVVAQAAGPGAGDPAALCLGTISG